MSQCCTVILSYIAQDIMGYILMVTLRKDVQEDGAIEKGCSSNDEVVQITTGQLHHPRIKYHG